NCLIITNKNPVLIGAAVNAHFYHCTFDQYQVTSPAPLISSTTPNWATRPSATFVNCIFANVPARSSGLVTVSGNNNGFYKSFAAFGVNNPPAGNYPFQAPTPGYGAYYLASDSTYRNAGTASLLAAILNDLKTRCVDPPDWIDSTPIISQETLIPHKYRYTTG